MNTETVINITFRNTPKSENIKNLIHKRIAKLNERFHIVSCDVVINKPHKSLNNGNEYQVEIITSIPNSIFAVHSQNYYLGTAVRDTLSKVESKLEKIVDKMQNKRS